MTIAPTQISFVERIRLGYLDAEEFASCRSVDARAVGDLGVARMYEIEARRAGDRADLLGGLVRQARSEGKHAA